VKVVGGARMVEIVDNGCHQGREDFQVGHPIGKASLRDEVVGRLKHITSVHIVVVRITICSVAGFYVI